MVDRVGIEPTDNCLQSSQEPQLNHSPYCWLRRQDSHLRSLAYETSEDDWTPLLRYKLAPQDGIEPPTP